MARRSLAAARQLHAELGAAGRDSRKQRRPSSNLGGGYQAPQVWRYRALRFTVPQRRRRRRKEEKEWRKATVPSRKAVPKANTSTARGLHRERAQRERVGQRMGAGRVAGRILVTSARRDRLATKVVKKDILESSRFEVYKQWERV